MLFIFWFSFFLLFYIYFGYPLAVKALAAVRSRPINKSEDHQPKVSILVAAYNEAKDIEATLRNKIALDYPSASMLRVRSCYSRMPTPSGIPAQ